MKRTLLLLVSLSLTFALSSCWRDNDENTQCGYCDDSGCWSCDGDFCWPVENEPCNENETCNAEEICTDFGCAKICTHVSECGLGEECLDSGYCGPEEPPETRCVVDDDCGNGTICEFDVSLDYYICVPGCSSDDECGEGEVCASCGRCAPEENPVCGGDSKVFCESDAECGSKVCSVDQKCALTCEMTEPACPTGQICSESVCIDDPDPQSPQCVFDANCDGGICLNSYCHTLCEVDTECGYGEFCSLGVCKADYRPDLD
jgi:hypothetical protein